MGAVRELVQLPFSKAVKNIWSFMVHPPENKNRLTSLGRFNDEKKARTGLARVSKLTLTRFLGGVNPLIDILLKCTPAKDNFNPL